MPRGGSGKGGHNPIIGDNNITATPSELAALTRNITDIFVRETENPPIDLKDPEQVKQAIYNYFLDCEQAGKRPGNMGLYRALNMNRSDASNVLNGKSKEKLSASSLHIFKKALQLLAEYREQLGAQGKLNPVTMIFWQKNFDNLTDTQTIEISPAERQQAELSPEQIQKAIEQDIPIDVESN